jgi:hypothetical protein
MVMACRSSLCSKDLLIIVSLQSNALQITNQHNSIISYCQSQDTVLLISTAEDLKSMAYNTLPARPAPALRRNTSKASKSDQQSNTAMTLPRSKSYQEAHGIFKNLVQASQPFRITKTQAVRRHLYLRGGSGSEQQTNPRIQAKLVIRRVNSYPKDQPIRPIICKDLDDTSEKPATYHYNPLGAVNCKTGECSDLKRKRAVSGGYKSADMLVEKVVRDVEEVVNATENKSQTVVSKEIQGSTELKTENGSEVKDS